MLVNLLLQDGKSNYMEGLMCELTNVKDCYVLIISDVPLPRHRSLLHSLIERTYSIISYGIYADHAHSDRTEIDVREAHRADNYSSASNAYGLVYPELVLRGAARAATRCGLSKHSEIA